MPHPNDQAALAMARDAFYAFAVYGYLDLVGQWAGWRLRGRDLVSPDGDRISPARLRGILFTESLRPRNRGLQGGEIIRLPDNDLQHDAGASAGDFEAVSVGLRPTPSRQRQRRGVGV